MDTKLFRLLNPKIFVGAAVAAFAIVLWLIAFSGSTIIDDISEGGPIGASQNSPEILPLEIELEDISILSITEKAATIEVKFKVTNPNFKSIILQMIKYELYESGMKITATSIGDRDMGFIAGSNYYTILSDRPTILADKVVVKNTGNTPEFWSALMNNDVNWKISGDAFYSLSSMTAGGETEVTFEFTK